MKHERVSGLPRGMRLMVVGGWAQKPPSPVYLISHHNCLSTPLECSVFMVTPAIQPASHPAPSVVVVVVVLHPVSTTLPHPMPMQVPSVLPMYACLPAYPVPGSGTSGGQWRDRRRTIYRHPGQVTSRLLNRESSSSRMGPGGRDRDGMQQGQ